MGVEELVKALDGKGKASMDGVSAHGNCGLAKSTKVGHIV